ncbi:YIP1 family protein [Sunxiuqinia dokdonensis]|nr:YIP1 family protein [Sunxiuqinia dokdonensis]
MRPLLSIWISPLATFEYLATKDESENRFTMNLLVALITIGMGISHLKKYLGLFDDSKLAGLLVGVVTLALAGIIVIRFVLPLTYWGVGKIFKGEANKTQIQLVVAYSLIPYLIYLAIGLILIIPAVITQNLDLLFYSHPVTYFVVWILAIRNLTYGLSYFNKFSYGYALLTVLITAGIAELVRMILLS